MWEPLAPAAEGGGEEKKELAKLECCLVPSFLLLPAWCAYLCVYYLLFNCPCWLPCLNPSMLLSLPCGLDVPLPHISIAETKSLDKLEGQVLHFNSWFLQIVGRR